MEPSEYKIYIYDIFGNLVDEVKLGYLSKEIIHPNGFQMKNRQAFILVLSNGFERHT